MESFPSRLCAGVLGATLLVVVLAGVNGFAVPAAEAHVAICQGLPATIEGPNSGQDTTGTEGNDVIVAPLIRNTTVQGLGGNDTICLVDGPVMPASDAGLSVYAGAGDDRVVNQSTPVPVAIAIVTELGLGVDEYVGNDSGEQVYGAGYQDPDTEFDTFETHGGADNLYSGTGMPGFANHDVIETGAGRDWIGYAGAAGGSIDNGEGADVLAIGFIDQWSGALSIDNLAHRAHVGGETVLSWTAIDQFGLLVEPGSNVSFAGSEAAETLGLYGTIPDLAASAATIAMGGGDDQVRLENYLPASVDTGGGDDTMSYAACDRATVRLAATAECTTHDGRQVVTSLTGVEELAATSTTSIVVFGTPRDDRVWAEARHVRVSTLGGSDRVFVAGRTAFVMGGRGADRLKAGGRGTIMYGGRGADVVRGGPLNDRLFGGPGQDKAFGQHGTDVCVAEVRVGCERR